MAVVFRVDGLRATRGFLGATAKRARDLAPALRSIGEEMLARTQSRLSSGVDVHGRPFKRSRRGGQTLWDSGALAASVNYELLGGTRLDLFSTALYARVHNEGLTIVPRQKKWLTIPLRAAGNRGTLNLRANRGGARARHYTKTFFLRRGGRLFLMQRDRPGALRALFLLVKKVQMPRREWLGYGAGDERMVAETIERHVAGESE